MSVINYEDFAYSSEEENEQMEGLDDHGHHDQGSVESDDTSAEVNDSNNDIDEYASFETDLEKYQYDQGRWNGIPNPRKYVIAQKSRKQKTKNPKEDQPGTSAKPAKRSKPEAVPKSTQAVDLPKEGELHFDTEESLWYTYKNVDVYMTERATFHHWIRPELSQIEDGKGTYDHTRKRGPGNYNITCFNKVEEHWGLQRPQYAPIMFEWEQPERRDPTYTLKNLYHQGLLVIDYWRTPVRNFLEIPLVISSAFEGGYMEPATRLHSKMVYEDIRARMPPFVQTIKNGVITYKALSKASTFSGRSRHFREKAGAITWDKREGSSKIRMFIEEIVKPINNSTQGSRDLTKDEVKRLRMMNQGTKPGRAKPGTTKQSKEKYVAETRKAAGLPAIVSGEKTGGEIDDRQELEVTDESMMPPRFVFFCKDLPTLRAMTEGEALMDPRVENLDPRNLIPRWPNELQAIRAALGVTIDHFKEILPFEPEIGEGSNYISEYCNIQDQVDTVFPEDAIALRRLGPWEGTIFDWERAQVVDDPCFGRRQPF